MTRTIYCNKLQTKAEGLDRPPYPGDIGQKIYDKISKAAWQQWLNHQTMLINEYRLNLTDSKAREFLLEEMEKFLFGDGGTKPERYVPPESEG